MLRISFRAVAVPIGVRCCFCYLKDTASNAGYLGIILICNCVITGSCAVGVDLGSLADLADDGKFAGSCIAVQYAVAVCVDIHVFDRADLRAGQKRIVVYRGTGCTACTCGARGGIRRGRRSRVKARAVVINRLAFCRRTCYSSNITFTTVDLGYNTCICYNCIRCIESIAFAYEVNSRSVVVINYNVTFTA